MRVDAAANVDVDERVRALKPSATLAIHEKSARLKAEGRKVYQLGFGQSPFPVPDAVVEALRANAHRKAYMPVRGLAELREAVAGYHGATAGDILIGPGSKELIYQLQLAVDADILLPSPSWVSYAPQAGLVGRNVAWIPARPRLGAEDLNRACAGERRKLLILNYPSNPTGFTLRDAELKEIAEVARRHELLVLSDEIYGELDHDGNHISIAKYYPEGTIVSAGLSKWCGAGGWRLGTFCFPRELRHVLDAMANIASETFTSVSAPIQYAGVTAYRPSKDIDDYRRDVRRILKAIGIAVSRRLNVEAPDGAFYLFPEFTKPFQSSEELCEKLLDDTGIALLPGSDFGRPPSELTCRLAYVNFDGAAALEAARKTSGELGEDFVKQHCAEVIEAIDVLGGWL
jgi:aspartate/methionine/tyrosine aminotransferase